MTLKNTPSTSSSSSSTTHEKGHETEATTPAVSVKASTENVAPPPLVSPPQPVGPQPYSQQFFDRSEGMTKARNMYIKILLQRTGVIVLAIFGVFSIYWGALMKLPARSLNGWVVDFDGDQVGAFVAPRVVDASGPVVTWHLRNASDFPNGPSDLAAAVVNEDCWVAISINPQTTTSLNLTVLATRDVNPFNSSDAITAFANEGRNENSFRTLLRPHIDEVLQEVTYEYATQLVTNLMQNNVSLTSIPPELIVRPIYYVLDNLRPFDVPVATAVTFIGLIYLLILSFIVVNAGILARAVTGLEKKLTTASLIRVRLISPIIVYLPLSLAYTLMTRAFSLPFERQFGRAGFVIFWMLSWFGMGAAGLALESMMTLLTMKYIQVFLILWIISNVSVCLWPIDALPVVYNYGHAAPFYQISRAVRTIVFMTKNEVGMNFGILFAWIVVSSCTLPVFLWFRRRGEIKVWKEKAQGTRV